MEVYFVSLTEIVSFILGLIVHFFCKENKPEKTAEFKTIFYAITLLMFRIIVELTMSVHIRVADNISKPFLTVLAFIYIILHIAVVNLMLIYVARLSGKKLATAKTNVLVASIELGYLILGAVMFAMGIMFHIENNEFKLVAFVPYTELISFVITMILFFVVLSRRKNYPRPLFAYIRMFVPIILFLQVVQIMSKEMLFSGFYYVTPLMVLFFLYHNTPYDTRNGSRNAAALEQQFIDLDKENAPFDFIYLKVHFSENEVKNGSLKKDYDTYWTYCRKLEYLNKHINLYVVERDVVGILFSISDEKKRNSVYEEVKRLIYEAAENMDKSTYFNAFHFKEQEILFSTGQGKAFMQYVLDKADFSIINSWSEGSDTDMKDFFEYQHIKSELMDIDSKQDLNDERVLVYAQPIYDTETGFFKTAECLMRLRLDGEMIPPFKFIPIAESMGCIHSLTLIMLNKVCKYVADNYESLSIQAFTVNISPDELADRFMSANVLKIINTHNINPSYIRLEITEGVETENNAYVKVNLANLAESGVKFYMDDFGTGYSNLSKLTEYSYHTIKFDKSIFYAAYNDASVAHTMESVIELFKDKGLHVLVEGVEDEEQSRFAHKVGFEMIQGFFYARPLPIEDIGSLFVKLP